MMRERLVIQGPRGISLSNFLFRQVVFPRFGTTTSVSENPTFVSSLDTIRQETGGSLTKTVMFL